jgi:transcriptional regulator with AAA-type ATPase domain
LSNRAIENLPSLQFRNYEISQLLHFFVRRVLAATAAEFLEFQPLGRRLPVLGRRVVPLFAVTAL